MKKNGNKISVRSNTKKTIVEDISRGVEREFLVGEDALLTLVVLGKSVTKSSQITVRLKGVGARATIVGCIIGDKQHTATMHTLQSHEAPETTSDLLVKSVLTDDASFVYDGAIFVDRKAQKTDAYQRNENLLLSSRAHAESKPKLEILANDVRCTHGATIGSVRDDELWYLKTRGIDSIEGTRLIACGFLESVTSRVSDKQAQERVRDFVHSGV